MGDLNGLVHQYNRVITEKPSLSVRRCEKYSNYLCLLQYQLVGPLWYSWWNMYALATAKVLRERFYNEHVGVSAWDTYRFSYMMISSAPITWIWPQLSGPGLLDACPQRGGFTFFMIWLCFALKFSSRGYECQALWKEVEYKTRYEPYALELTSRPGAQDHDSYNRHTNHTHTHLQRNGIEFMMFFTIAHGFNRCLACTELLTVKEG